jgi:hypothetical protein
MKIYFLLFLDYSLARKCIQAALINLRKPMKFLRRIKLLPRFYSMVYFSPIAEVLKYGLLFSCKNNNNYADLTLLP